MKLDEVINRAARYEQDIGYFTDVWDQHISKECSEIVEVYRKTRMFFYRGIRSFRNADAPTVFRTTIRQQRRGLDSSLGSEERKVVDEAYSRLGIDANRSNSIFCVNTNNGAAAYGDPFIIFPVNGFKYSYFPIEGTAFWRTKAITRRAFENYDLDPTFLDDEADRNRYEEHKNDIVNFVARQLAAEGLTNEGIVNAIERHSQEVLITGDKYYGVNSLCAQAIKDILR